MFASMLTRFFLSVTKNYTGPEKVKSVSTIFHSIEYETSSRTSSGFCFVGEVVGETNGDLLVVSPSGEGDKPLG